MTSFDTFNAEQRERYQRHLMLTEIGTKGQEKWANSHVLVVGAGGLGCPVLLYLAAAGVGRITILDPDRVSLSNLQRQIIYQTPDVGQFKAEVASQRIRLLNPNVTVEFFNSELSLSNIEKHFKNTDVVVDCSDNFSTRYLINDACVLWSKPLSYAAVYRMEGQAGFFRNAPEDPCLRCVFPQVPAPGLLQNCTEAGVLGVLPGFFGVWQAKDVLRYLINPNIVSPKIHFFDLWGDTKHVLSIKKNPLCPVCKISGNEQGMKDFSLESLPSLPWKSISCQKVFSQISRYTIIDVRTEEEFVAGHLPHSKNLPLLLLHKETLEGLNREKAYLIVCRSGGRSAQACLTFVEQGFKNITNLEGGLMAWKTNQNPEMDVI